MGLLSLPSLGLDSSPSQLGLYARSTGMGVGQEEPRLGDMGSRRELNMIFEKCSVLVLFVCLFVRYLTVFQMKIS